MKASYDVQKIGMIDIKYFNRLQKISGFFSEIANRRRSNGGYLRDAISETWNRNPRERKVSSMLLHRNNNLYNLIEDVPEGWTLVMGCNRANSDSWLREVQLTDEVDAFWFAQLYHEKGHAINSGNEEDVVLKRFQYPKEDITYNDLEKRMGYEHNAWEYVVARLRELDFPDRHMSHFFEIADWCLGTFFDHEVAEEKQTHWGATYRSPLQAVVDNTGEDADEIMSRLKEANQKWRDKTLVLRQ